MPESFPLVEIADAFGISFKNVEQPEHSFFDNVFILDEKFVLKARYKSAGLSEHIEKEAVLVSAIQPRISWNVPEPMRTTKGDLLLASADRIWTGSSFLPGRILGSWKTIPQATDAENKSVLTSLRSLHDATKNLELHAHDDLSAFPRDLLEKHRKIEHLLSPHANQRIKNAVVRVEESRRSFPGEEACFIHGDYHHGNLLTDVEGNTTGLIDFDRSGIGHPLEDLSVTVAICLSDYRSADFTFNDPLYKQFLDWYGLHSDEQSLFAEYFILACVTSVWNFFAAQVLENRDFYLSYQISKLQNVCARFTTEGSKTALPGGTSNEPRFPVELRPRYMELARELKISGADIDEHFIRGKGHGGQKINKTSSCVELNHRPTGISVRVQQYREQHKNRIEAYKLLIEKIEEREKGSESRRAKENFKIRKQKMRRSRKAKEKMLDEKKKRGEQKKLRKDII